MTIRFAGSNATRHSALHAWRCRSVPLCAANDNAREPHADVMLASALRHFARHGLASAERAESFAQAASLQGDQERCAFWLEVFRRFDRRSAARLASRLATNIN